MAVYLGTPSDISVFGQTFPSDVGLVSTFGYIGGGVAISITIPNHVERALSLLIEEFKKSTDINSIVEVSVDQSQEIENTGNDLLTARSLSQAGGAQLDGMGAIVGVERGGRNDEDYRAAIRFQIFVNTSNGEPETLITALKFVTGASRIRLWEISDATVFMFTNGSFIPDDVAAFMDDIAASGVSLEYVAASFNTLPFAFALDGTDSNSEGGGWNELGYAPGGIEVGGQWTEGFFT